MNNVEFLIVHDFIDKINLNESFQMKKKTIHFCSETINVLEIRGRNMI